MHKIIESISRNFGYGKIGKKYYGRIGAMINRYGTSTILHAINDVSSVDESNLTHLLNIIEKRCQKNINNNKTEFDWNDV